MCDDFLAALRQGGNPGIQAQMVAEQAQLHRHLAYQAFTALSGTALMLVIELASAGCLSPLAPALAGNCVTAPVGAGLSGTQAVSDSWFTGGYEVELLSGPAPAQGFARLDFTWPAPMNLPHAARRLPFLFAPEEAACAFYLPPRYPVPPPAIAYRQHNALPAPAGLPTTGCLLGTTARSGGGRKVRIAAEDRKRHMYIIGQTGTGKTTLLQTMILDDIHNGEGLCFIDPHGDAFRAILERIPNHRARDVIAFDVTADTRSLGLNLLEAANPRQRHFLAQELVHIVYHLVAGAFGSQMAEHSMGPVFAHHLRMNALLAMSNPADPGTLLELYNIFTINQYWKRWIPLNIDDSILHSWVSDTLRLTNYVDPKREVSGLGSYIASKFENFVFDPRLRRVFGQKKSAINFLEIMDTGKVLLINLAKGELSDENSRFLGMIILGKLMSAIQERVRMPADQRRPFHLYVDEFQNVVTPTFINMLSEARKFGLTVVLANQFISQIKDASVISAILGNVGTTISFRLGREDADMLRYEYAPLVDGQDLVSLPALRRTASY